LFLHLFSSPLVINYYYHRHQKSKLQARYWV
jgi:hypothetical protein